ncbi:MAG: esterase family protein [Muribaculaceae bacterium]|nr:esterase family protein [Muribaculaceae bacterium]
MKRILSFLLLLCALTAARAAHVDTLAIRTFLLESPEEVLVIVPDSIEAGKRLPVVYLLHGHGGAPRHWLDVTQPRLPELAERYGMIFVLPDGHNSWYFDSPVDDKMQMETFITDELVKYIDKNYPTIADSRHRAVTGLSMGGHGSLYLAFRHPDIFGNAGSMSGGVDILPFPERWNIKDYLGDYNKYPQRWAEASVINNVERLKPGDVNIIFDCGVDDFFAKVNDRLHETLRVAKIPHDYISRPGGHSHAYWANSLLYHLLYFDSKFKAADR